MKANLLNKINYIDKSLTSISGVCILCYHSVHKSGPSRYPYSIPLIDFKRQIDYLIETFEISSVDSAINPVDEKHTEQNLKFIITFDDGYKNVIKNAVPFLERRRVPSLFFLTSSLLSSNLNSFMNQKEAKNLNSSALFSVGSHANNHWNLLALESTDKKKQVVQSKIQLQQILGSSIKYFAFPGGAQEPEIEDYLQEAGYKKAFLDNMKKKSELRRDFSIKRFCVKNMHKDLNTFKRDLWINSQHFSSCMRSLRGTNNE